MNIIDQHKRSIQLLCEEHKVKKLYAFGSVLTNYFGKDSDIDLVVDFERLNTKEYAENYFSLKFSLEKILHRNIDLLEESAITNPYFKEAIEKTRQVVYGN